MLLGMSAVLSKAFPNHSAEQIVAPIARHLPAEGDKIPADEALKAQLARDIDRVKAERAEQEAEIGRKAGREPYTEAEITRWMDELGIESKEAIARQLILDHKGDYWVFYDGRYDHVGGKHKASNYVRAKVALTAAVLPVSTGEHTPKGYVPKSFDVLCEQYSKTIEHVQKSLRAASAVIEYDSGRGTTLTAPMYPGAGRDEAVRDAQLERYLEIIAGTPEQLAALQAWLKTTHPRAVQVASPKALYLEGPSNVGKSENITFGVGLQYTSSGYFDANRYLEGGFGDELERTPVGLIDERAPRGAIDAFKSATTDSHVKINPKGRPAYVCEGAPIFVVATNDGRGFFDDLTGGRPVDVAVAGSVARRGVYIQIPADALERLHSEFGGPEGFYAFGVRCRAERLVPRYVAWLQGQEISADDRASRDIITRYLAGNGGVADCVLAHVATSLERQQGKPVFGQAGPDCDRGVHVADGRVWINASELGAEWERYTAFARKPSAKDLASAVEHMTLARSTKEARKGDRKIVYRELNWEAFAAGLGLLGRDPDEYRMRVLAVSLWRCAQRGDKTPGAKWKPWKHELEALRADGREHVTLAPMVYEVPTSGRAASESRLTQTPPLAA